MPDDIEWKEVGDDHTPPPRTPQNSLQDEINQALADISDALRDYPPVSLDELDGVSIAFYYRLESEEFSEVSEIQNVRNTILTCIRKKRAAKKDEEDDHSDPLAKYKNNA